MSLAARISFRASALLVLLSLSSALLAQPAHPAPQSHSPTLDQILDRLESNLNHYRAEVPSFFCDEHVVSEMEQMFAPVEAQRHQRTVYDSVFRVKRVVDRDKKATLTESREIKAINNRPAKGKNLPGPATLLGAFSGGLALVSVSQQSCMSYTLRPSDPGQPYMVEFASLPNRDRPANCLLQADAAGRVLIDPDSMQVTRVDLTASSYTIEPASSGQDPLVGVWTLSVDYAPVQLDQKAFWMPVAIYSKLAASGPNSITWSFDAHYGDFHKLEVTSRILPSDTAFAP